MCAKPQREEDIPKSEPAVAVQAPPPPPLPAPLAVLTFRNGAALRVGFLAALLSLLLSLLVPLPAVGTTLGGFFSVYLYRRRTGQAVSVLGGARIGWMTGMILFLIVASMVGLGMMALSNVPGGAKGLADQMRNSPVPMQKEVIDQVIQFMQQPSKVALALADAFLMITLSAIAGGAIGARLLGRIGSSPGRPRL
jgi:hypothetical protein